MIHLIVASHGPLSASIVKSASLIAGSSSIADIKTISITMETSVEEVRQAVETILESFDENGTATYIGFLREKNTFDNDEEIDTDSDQIFKEKTAEYGAAAVVDFTVVE